MSTLNLATVVLAFLGAAYTFHLVRAELRLVKEMRRHRTDLSPGQTMWEGSAIFVGRNVGEAANYTKEGQVLLGRLQRTTKRRAVTMFATIFGLYIGLVLL